MAWSPARACRGTHESWRLCRPAQRSPGGDRTGPTQTLYPLPLLTVTWKGLLGTCSPPKRTQMTYLPGWGAV